MKSRSIISAGIIGFIVLCLLCLFLKTGKIEQYLYNRVTADLQKDGIPPETVSLNGRDVILNGVIANQEKKEYVGKKAAGAYGVRTVVNNLRIAEALVLNRPALKVAVSADSILLEGSFPDSLGKSKVLTAVTQVFSKDKMIDKTEINTELNGVGWQPLPKGLFNDIKQYLVNGGFHFNGKEFVLFGNASSDLVKKAIEKKIQSSLKSYLTFKSQVKVKSSIPEGPKLQQELEDLFTANPILFNSNTAILTAKSKSVLDKVIAVLKQYSDIRIKISGHTDSSGNESYNLLLSLRRAQAVLAYMNTQNFNTISFTVMGYGSSKPIADNATVSGRKKNRRIEFQIEENK